MTPIGIEAGQLWHLPATETHYETLALVLMNRNRHWETDCVVFYDDGSSVRCIEMLNSYDFEGGECLSHA